jgi:hypothetical protein
MSSYSEGFKLGYSANAPLAGISEGIQKFTQEYRKQEEIGRQRQEAYDKARSEFKNKQEETYGKYAKEDLYDNTGFTDFDTLGDKFTKSARETYEINEFAFRNGFIDESELTARNNTLKAQSQKLTKVFDEANKMLEEKEKLEAQGLGNKLNDIRLDLLEDFSKNVKVSSGLDGLYMSTIGKDGKQKNISVSEFSKILQADSGVDMQKDLDDLLKLGGYREYTTKDGKRAVRSYDRDDELGKSLIKTKVYGYTDQQVIDAMFELGLAADNPEEAKEGVKLISTKNIFDFEVNDKTRDQVATAMQDKLREQQKFKMISTEAKPKDQPVDKSLVSTTKIIAEDANDKKGDRIRFSPNKLQGLPMSYIQKYKGFQESIGEQIAKDNLVGYEVDARKDATFLGANYFPDRGVFEIEIGYDVIQPGDEDTMESTRQSKRSTMTLNTLAEINDFYAGVGRKDLMISSKNWEASRQRREKEKGNQGTGSKYNK